MLADLVGPRLEVGVALVVLHDDVDVVKAGVGALARQGVGVGRTTLALSRVALPGVVGSTSGGPGRAPHAPATDIAATAPMNSRVRAASAEVMAAFPSAREPPGSWWRNLTLASGHVNS